MKRILFRPLVSILALCGANSLNPELAFSSEAINNQDEVVTINLAPSDPADRVLQILRTEDKQQTNRYIAKAVELKNVEAREIMPALTDIVTLERGTIRGARTNPVGEGGQPRYFIIITTTPEQMPSVEAVIAQLDVPGFVNSSGRHREAFRVRYRRASELATVLRGTRATGQTRFFADDLTNTLYYDDSEHVLRSMASYVEFYDVPLPQIEFDVQIVEVREADSSKLGLDWDAWKRSIGGQFALTGTQFEGGSGFLRLDTLLTLDANALANFLNYTTQNGNSRLVQRSRLNASNLEPVVISDMKRVGHYDYERTERTPVVITEQNPRVNTFEEVPSVTVNAVPRVVTTVPPVHNRLVEMTGQHEGLMIRIEPMIAMEVVTARIEIAMNTVTGLDRLDRPVITEQRLSNQFTLEDGEKILLGTLERNLSVDSRRGIPGLKSLPVLKYLFSVESERIERSRLFILATPKFSNVQFEAPNLRALGTQTPALKRANRQIDLHDGALDDFPEFPDN